MSDNLRAKLIRLAHSNPALRADLLPLLASRKAAPLGKTANLSQKEMLDVVLGLRGLVKSLTNVSLKLVVSGNQITILSFPGWHEYVPEEWVARNLSYLNKGIQDAHKLTDRNMADQMWKWKVVGIEKFVAQGATLTPILRQGAFRYGSADKVAAAQSGAEGRLR